MARQPTRKPVLKNTDGSSKKLEEKKEEWTKILKNFKSPS